MKNCIVEKLKGTTDNVSWNYFEELVLDVFQEDGTPSYGHRNIDVRMPTYGTFKAKVISGSIYFTDSTGSANYGTNVNLAERHDLYISNGIGRILIEGKYNINSLTIQSTEYIKVDLGQMDYITPSGGLVLQSYNTAIGELPAHSLFRIISCGESSCEGDMSEIDTSLLVTLRINNTSIGGSLNIQPALNVLGANYSRIGFNTSEVKNSNITKLNVTSCSNVGGLLSDCGNGKLTELECRDSGITGSIESYVEADWEKERRAGNVSVLFGGLNQTFNNNSYESKALYIVFAADGVAVHENNVSGEVIATYDGTSWTYI